MAGKSLTSDDEQRYRTIFENMRQGYVEAAIIRDADGRAIDYVMLDANSQYHRLTGIPVEKAIGRRAREIVPDLEQAWIDRFDNIVRSRKSERFDHPHELATNALKYGGLATSSGHVSM